MFCPICGGKLELVERKSFEYNDEWWDIPNEKEQDEYLEKMNEYESCKREEYKCTGRGCFKEDYPLYFHHPFQGIDAAPGDSWSLSWIK